MMKRKVFLTSLVMGALLLGACGNDNDTALRNDDNAELRGVTYNNPDNFKGANNYPDRFRADNNFNVENQENRLNVNRTTNEKNRQPNNTYNTQNNNENRMRVADRAAAKIAEIREVDRANVIVTDDNAYVAVNLEDNTNKRISKEVERKITDLVKSTDRDIDNVYISLNPDFYNRTTTYANDIRAGRPIEGFFDEFGELVRRVFPTKR